MSEDISTVQLADGTDPDEVAERAPMLPVDIEDVDPSGSDVLGAVRINDATHSGIWNLTLEAGTAVNAMRVVGVDDRLTEGTYALVRVDDPDGDS